MTVPTTDPANIPPSGVISTDNQFTIGDLLPPAPPSGRYTDEDLERVRSQEKNKLYPQIHTLQEKLALLEKEREERLAQAEAEKQRLEEDARKKHEAEMDVRTLLETKERDWQQQLEAERAERERAFELLNHERQFQELSQYRNQRVEAERDNIMPELLDLVSGNSPEEIEASITGLKERSTRILESATQAMSATRRDMQGSRVTSPPAGPLDTHTANQPMSDDQIANLSFSDYVKNRTKLLGQAAASRSTGIFG